MFTSLAYGPGLRPAAHGHGQRQQVCTEKCECGFYDVYGDNVSTGELLDSSGTLRESATVDDAPLVTVDVVSSVLHSCGGGGEAVLATLKAGTACEEVHVQL